MTIMTIMTIMTTATTNMMIKTMMSTITSAASKQKT